MSIPVSSGIGTGAAQVYDTSRSYNAMSKVLDANADYAERLNKQKALEAAEKKKQAQTDYFAFLKDIDYNPSNLRAADVDYARIMVDEIRNKYSGKAADIYSGGQTSLEWSRDIGKFKDFIGNSISSKPKELELVKQIVDNPDYTDEQKKDLLTKVNTTGVVFERDLAGKYAPKLNLPSFLESDKLFEKEVFYEPDSKVETDKGVFFKSGKRLPDAIAKEIWKNGLMAGGDGLKYIQAINATYPDLDEDEKWDRAWATYRDSKLATPDNELVSTTKEPKEDKGGGFAYDNKNWNIGSFVDSNNNENLVITDKKGKNLQIPQQKVKATDGKEYLLKNGVVQGIRVDDGTPIVKLSGVIYVKNDKDEFVEQPLMPKEMVLDETTWGNISTAIGINSTLGEFINSLPKSFKTKTTIDSKVLDISNNPIGSNKSNKPDPLNLGF